MPRQPRNYIKTSFLHVMTQGINKNYIFNEDQDIKFYISEMYKNKEKYNINIISYCIMNNHAHMLLQVKDIEKLSKYMQSLNTKYAIYYNKKHNRVGYVFRDRYRSEGINSEEQLKNCICYIYNNPVKAKICQKPEDYPYSNYKFSKFKIDGNMEYYQFIDVENKNYNEIIRSYMDQKNLTLESLLNDKEALKEMVIFFRKQKISFRNMEKELYISREKLRKLVK